MFECGLKDMKYIGHFFPSSNKREGDNRIFSKIDRVLCNEEWEGIWPNIEACFLPEGTFDHTLMLLSFFKCSNRRSSFKFCNHWAQKDQFIPIVEKIWSQKVHGHLSFQI